MIFNPFERMVAFRYLRARRQEGFISVIAIFSLLGIALGVATLIIVMSVMNGFRAELLGRILGLNGHLGVYGTAGALAEFDELAGRLRGIPGVTEVVPLVEGQVMATSQGHATGAMVRGLRLEDIRDHSPVGAHMIDGGIDRLDDDSVLIGTRMAFRMGLRVGDDLTLISPQGTTTAFGTVPRIKSYRIAGTFELGMSEYDSSFVFMPLAAAQLFFNVPNAVTSLEIFTSDPDDVRPVRRAVAEAVGDKGRVFDWQQANSSFFNAIQVERNVMFLILTLIILVAAFNIISSMIMLVKDKGRDIAILRTMGATRGMVLRIFILTGASIGVVGTVAGFLLGLGFAANIETIRQGIQHLTGTQLFDPTIYFLSQLPAKVDPTEVAVVVVMALALSFLATLYPSWRAARLDPVEALRYE
jgi:lipoprotein-releasing system permease protein